MRRGKLARPVGCRGSGRSDRYRLDPGGNRQLNHAFYLLAIIKISHDSDTAVYLAKQRANGKPTATRSATSNATSSGASTTSSATPSRFRPPSS
jgi:hypothetical protein